MWNKDYIFLPPFRQMKSYHSGVTNENISRMSRSSFDSSLLDNHRVSSLSPLSLLPAYRLGCYTIAGTKAAILVQDGLGIGGHKTRRITS